MSQQVRVEDTLVFAGRAARSGNVKGNISTEKVVFVDHFQKKAIDTTFDYNSAGEAGGAAAHEAPHMMVVDTHTGDDDEWTISTQLNYQGQYNSIFEVRARCSDVTGLQFNICFADAIVYANKIAFAYDSGSLDTEPTSGAGFVFDPGATLKYVYGVSVNTNADGENIFSTTHVLVNDTWATFRMELRDRGSADGHADAIFYFNKTGAEIDPVVDMIGIEASAVPRDTPLCLFLGVMNYGAGTDNIDVDYVKTWSDAQ